MLPEPVQEVRVIMLGWVDSWGFRRREETGSCPADTEMQDREVLQPQWSRAVHKETACLQEWAGGAGDGSAIENTCCSRRAPKLSSQHWTPAVTCTQTRACA